MINAGSHSRLSTFETCNFRAKLSYIDKIPEPDRGEHHSGEWPNDRGTRIHNESEAYVKGEGPMGSEMKKFFEPEFKALAQMYKDGQVIGEEMWCFDKEWTNLPWNDADPNKWDVFDQIWFRIKTDVTVFESKSSAIIVDYKSGKRYGNEVKHAEQMELYAVGAFLKYPQLKEVTTELWYIDQNELADMVFTREEAMQRLTAWHERNTMMTTCDVFEPSPNSFNCKWCPYGPAKSGDCTVGIQ